MDPENIRAVTQSVIAVIVVGGGGIFMYLQPANASTVTGIIGTVVAYYFLTAVQTTTAKAVTAAVTQAQAATAAKAANGNGAGAKS